MMRWAVSAVLLLMLAAPAWAGFDEGLAAYKHGDYGTALREFRLGAAESDARAQYALGVMYAKGRGVAQDYAEAVTWYRKAAVQGDYRAQTNLGLMYADGLGVPQDYAAAVIPSLADIDSSHGGKSARPGRCGAMRGHRASGATNPAGRFAPPEAAPR